MKYAKVYFRAGTNTVLHCFVKDTPFGTDEGVIDDDHDLDEVEFEFSDAPQVVPARELMRSLQVDGTGRARIDIALAREDMRNVSARGLNPEITPSNNDTRKRIARARRGAVALGR